MKYTIMTLFILIPILANSVIFKGLVAFVDIHDNSPKNY